MGTEKEEGLVIGNKAERKTSTENVLKNTEVKDISKSC